MRWLAVTIALSALAGALCALPAAARAACPEALRWRALQRGVAYATVDVACAGPPAERISTRDRKLHVVRIAPRKVTLRALMTSALGGQPLTAAQWAKQQRLALAINLGMYQTDHRTHVGYLRAGDHVNSARWVRSYLSALDLRRTGTPRAALIDLDDPRARAGLAHHDLVVQNLRLIRGDGARGRGVWSRRRSRRWSEAALAQDRGGRLLLLFARAPLSMWEFNRLLLALPLGVVRAMHLEGGPEASLSIHAGGVDLDLCGSFETGFVADDSNAAQWPLPNVLGVARRGSR